MTTKLVVADAERSDKTICLAVSPAMKELSVKNRCRLYEIPKNIDYIIAPPRMKKYIAYTAKIYGIYLQYMSKDDIYQYSIDDTISCVILYDLRSKLGPFLASKHRHKSSILGMYFLSLHFHAVQ
jgi:DNA polymerase V